MKLQLPLGMSAAAFHHALAAYAGVVGREWALDTGLGCDTYRDI